MKLFSYLFTFFFTLFSHLTYSNPKDSVSYVLSDIATAYQKGKLSERAYLDTIYTMMNGALAERILFSNKELLVLLRPYREAIWRSKDNGSHKINYYGILSNQAQLSGRLGEMRYYAEKINEQEQKRSKQPSITALTIIADYYNALWSYSNVQELYLTNKNFILTIPEKAAQGKIELNQLVQSSIMLEKFGEALFELKDTLNGKEVEVTLDRIASVAKDRYSDHYYEIANIDLSRISVNFSRGDGLDSGKIIRASIKMLEKFNENEHIPDNLKEGNIFTITDNKVQLFLDESNADSAAYYIRILESMIGDQPNLYTNYMIQKYKSRALYAQGRYKNSIDTLINAMLFSEQIRQDIVKDVNEMMYAQAKAEEQELLLVEANTKRKNTELQLFITIAAIILLLTAGVLILQHTRRKQKSRFLEFKLNMARNIHDETSPALLYAKALAKSSRTDIGKSDLEQHIEHTIEIIRSLSHDLKSNKQQTLNDLVQYAEEMLKKLNIDNTFAYVINKSIEEKRFISHYQFEQLKAILNECIINTIKHAVFNNITISFLVKSNKLTITYTDDGKGWDTHIAYSGIGIKNMEERTLHLNGDWAINNTYPDGYTIQFSVLLR